MGIGIGTALVIAVVADEPAPLPLAPEAVPPLELEVEPLPLVPLEDGLPLSPLPPTWPAHAPINPAGRRAAIKKDDRNSV